LDAEAGMIFPPFRKKDALSKLQMIAPIFQKENFDGYELLDGYICLGA
jgi:hypothetical protein